jgi:hypothetical protein
MMTGIRSCSGAMAAFAARVMMVNDSTVSLAGGETDALGTDSVLGEG